MKLNKTLEIMSNCILDLKVKGQSTPPTYFRRKICALLAWNNKQIFNVACG